MTRAPFPGSPLSGTDLMTGLNNRFKQLYDRAPCNLAAVGGTADAVTATLVPALDGDGLLDGMLFSIVWGAANTSGMTLALNGGSPVPILNPDGSAMPPGSVEAGFHSLLCYMGGDFIVVSPTLASGGEAARYAWTFTASGTWTKPDGLLPDTPVFIEAWGGGGGGGANLSPFSAGGGGAYASRVLRLSDLTATVTATIGAGGAIATQGGNSTFGAFLTAYGGGAGFGGTNQGGGGGGSQAAGLRPTAGRVGGGEGATASSGAGDSIFGGGGGGSTASPNGGWSDYGGGGGAVGIGVGQPGQSKYGGAGGAATVAGSAPGGGGGAIAAGARGEIRVWI